MFAAESSFPILIYDSIALFSYNLMQMTEQLTLRIWTNNIEENIFKYTIIMDIKVIFLLTMATYCAFCQLTRDPKLGTTEGRVSCLEDTYMRLESYGTAMRKKMNEMEGKVFYIIDFNDALIKKTSLYLFYVWGIVIITSTSVASSDKVIVMHKVGLRIARSA